MTEEDLKLKVKLFRQGAENKTTELRQYIGSYGNRPDLELLLEKVQAAITARNKHAHAKAEYEAAYPFKEVPAPEPIPVYHRTPDKYGRLGH